MNDIVATYLRYFIGKLISHRVSTLVASTFVPSLPADGPTCIPPPMFLPAVYNLASLSGGTPMAYPNTTSRFSAVTLATPHGVPPPTRGGHRGIHHARRRARAKLRPDMI